jgi:hypothetical protein
LEYFWRSGVFSFTDDKRKKMGRERERDRKLRASLGEHGER